MGEYKKGDFQMNENNSMLLVSKIKEQSYEQEQPYQLPSIREEGDRYRHARGRIQRILSDSVGMFLEEEDGFTFDPKGKISSSELYEIYCQYCLKVGVPPLGIRALSLRLKRNGCLYPVVETTITCQGGRVRGFRGIRGTLVTDKANSQKGDSDNTV